SASRFRCVARERTRRSNGDEQRGDAASPRRRADDGRSFDGRRGVVAGCGAHARALLPDAPHPMNERARPSPLVALRYRNFRLLWGSQLVSMAGSMMQNAAILWHVSLLVPPSERGLALGMVGLVKVVPIIAFSLVSGVVADALDRRRLMLVTQSGMALAAAALAAYTFSGGRSLWPVYVLAAVSSAFGSFDGPARQSLIPNLVPREHLPNAISLNTIMFQ